MERTPNYDCYVQILKEELIPAMGCTEPIAIALAAAKARELLGEETVENANPFDDDDDGWD